VPLALLEQETAMSYSWRCALCTDDDGTGQADTEPAAARAFLDHYTTHHPDPVTAWNRTTREGDAA
jgi:hypothetical protein